MENIQRKYFFVVLVCFCVLIMILRRPDTLFYANFWAEDGRLWYSQMYNEGVSSFFYPAAGYLQTVSRLAMFFSLPFGIINAPLISNILSYIIRVCPVIFLFSKRFSFVPVPYKFLIMAYWLVMPNVDEVWGNITNVQWYTALYMLMVVIADPPNAMKHKIHDCVVMTVFGLSGPFVLFVFPCLLLRKICNDVYKMRFKYNYDNVIMVITLLVTIIQIICIINFGERTQGTLGASFVLLAKIVTEKIIIGSILPMDIAYDFVQHHDFLSTALLSIMGLSLMYFFLTSSWRFKVAVTFSVLTLSACFISPLASPTEAAWPLMLHPMAGNRYFVISNVMFFAYVIYLLDVFIKKISTNPIPKVVAMMMISLFVISILSFNISPLSDHNYRDNIRNIYDVAKKGDKVIIPINPSGWNCEIIKK